MTVAELPKGSAPEPLGFAHFPDRLHAYIWRNWSLVPVPRLARVIGARAAEVRRLGLAMGLGNPPRITRSQQARRNYRDQTQLAFAALRTTARVA